MSICIKDDFEIVSDVERYIKRPILDETDHDYHRESFLNMVRNFKTSRRKEAQKRNKTKKPKRWALKKKPRSIRELSGGGGERNS